QQRGPPGRAAAVRHVVAGDVLAGEPGTVGERLLLLGAEGRHPDAVRRGQETVQLAALVLEVRQRREADLAGRLGRLAGVEEGRRGSVPLEGGHRLASLEAG